MLDMAFCKVVGLEGKLKFMICVFRLQHYFVVFVYEMHSIL